MSPTNWATIKKASRSFSPKSKSHIPVKSKPAQIIASTPRTPVVRPPKTPSDWEQSPVRGSQSHSQFQAAHMPHSIKATPPTYQVICPMCGANLWFDLGGGSYSSEAYWYSSEKVGIEGLDDWEYGKGIGFDVYGVLVIVFLILGRFS